MEPTDKQEQPARIGYLDGLRGLAALVVVLHHFAGNFYPALISGNARVSHNRWDFRLYATPLNLAVAGNYAVCIFFVMSGFVLSYKYFRTHDREVIFSSAVRRYPRLAIPVLGSVLLSYLLISQGWFINNNLDHITGTSTWPTVWHSIPNFFDVFRQGLVGTFQQGQDSYNAVLWTMQYEMFGSFLVFGFLSLFGTLSKRWIIYAALILFFINTYYLAFVIGIMLSDYWSQIRSWVSNYRLTPWVLMATGLLLGSVVPPAQAQPLSLNMGGPLVFIHIFGAGLLLAGIICSQPMEKFLSRKPLLFLGRISFSIYLIHLLIISSVSDWFFLRIIGSLSYLHAVAATLALTLVLVLAAGYMYAKYVDEFAIRAGRTLYRKHFL